MTSREEIALLSDKLVKNPHIQKKVAEYAETAADRWHKKQSETSEPLDIRKAFIDGYFSGATETCGLLAKKILDSSSEKTKEV